MLIVRVLTSEGVFRDALSNDLLTSMIGGDTAGSSGQRIVCEIEVWIWGWEELRRFGLQLAAPSAEQLAACSAAPDDFIFLS